MTKKILIAKVISAFGIKGEVKIINYCQEPLQLEKYPLFDAKGNSLQLKISNKNKTAIGSNSSGAPIFIAKITGVDDRNNAEKIRGTEIFINRQDLKQTSEDEFYYADLIGLDVVDKNTKKIGKVIDVQDFGAGGMLEIEFDEEFRKSDLGKNLEKIENFPFSNKIFPQIDLKNNFIVLEIPQIL
ncbi:MAG: ribosome maturation factor RimM [Rickettsiales bacterium]|nr:ribosome maturation factor RimM [Rickettsiales bacterium]